MWANFQPLTIQRSVLGFVEELRHTTATVPYLSRVDLLIVTAIFGDCRACPCTVLTCAVVACRAQIHIRSIQPFRSPSSTTSGVVSRTYKHCITRYLLPRGACSIQFLTSSTKLGWRDVLFKSCCVRHCRICSIQSVTDKH